MITQKIPCNHHPGLRTEHYPYHRDAHGPLLWTAPLCPRSNSHSLNFHSTLSALSFPLSVVLPSQDASFTAIIYFLLFLNVIQWNHAGYIHLCLTSATQSYLWDSSVLLWMCPLFSWLYNIPTYVCTTICLSAWLLMKMWVVSRWGMSGWESVGSPALKF